MKKLIYGGLFLAIVGITILACKKENVATPNQTSAIKNNSSTAISKQKGELVFGAEKSTRNASLDSMAQAAGIGEIEYVSSGDKFGINLYNDNDAYVVHVQKFYIDSIIKFNITVNSNNYGVEIDVKAETIDIDNVGSFTFNNFFDANGVNKSSGKLKNITAVFTPYYQLFGKTTSTWSDNGDDDPYKPEWRFWGSEEVSRGPCDPLLHMQTVCYDDFAFWIRVHKNRCEWEPC